MSVSRRELLLDAGAGLSSVALSCMFAEHAGGQGRNGLHHPAKIKRVVQVFLCGGISHIDTFDYKPELTRLNGKPLSGKGTIDTFFSDPGMLLQSPFPFRQYGESGRWVSTLLPHFAECVDDLTFFQSMTSKSSNHTPATFFMNTGVTMNGFPSIGAWLSYGLGTENQDLPAYVVLPDPRGLPAGGSINWTAGFLGAVHQGVPMRTGGGDPILSLNTPAETAPDARRAATGFLQRRNAEFAKQYADDPAMTARIRSYELAARMQVSVPEAVRLDDEPRHIQRLYGMDKPHLNSMAKNYLMARRLLERGVRFVQIFNGGAFGSPRINWDAHEDIVENHTKQAALFDQPAAALLKDLKQRGMLKDTLVLYTTEFGRTPFTQGVGKPGRDHHPNCFTVWAAGAGLKPGIVYGASDEVGYNPAEKATTVYDLHATILHLLGIDHKRLTFYYNGIHRRLTDVHGELLPEVLA
jgi:hypothetical protein